MRKFIALGIWVLSACLASLPAQDVAGVRQINGRGIYCRAIGTGEPLVVVHGGPGLAHDYLFASFSRLAKKRRLVFYDQMGSGRSEAFRQDGKVGMDDLVAELEGVRKDFGLERFDLAGQSWGAIIAIHYAIRYPQNVKRLLLLEPAPGSSEYLPAFQKTIMDRLSPEDKETLAAYGKNPALASDPVLCRKWMNLRFKAYYFDPARQDMGKLDYFDGERVKKFFASSAMFGPYLLNFDLYETMKGIACPALIVHGDHDPVPTAAVERMALALKNAELKIVRESGHFVHVEKAEEYFGAIEAFLGGK
jgi:proline iminopeptidase